jgi:transposase
VLSLPASVRVFVCTLPTDMRRGYDGLAALVRGHFGQDPLGGHLFVFANRRADRLKILYWDRDGFALWMKRLEKGAFRLPGAADRAGATGVEVSSAGLLMLLEGIDASAAKRRPRYAGPAPRNSRQIASDSPCAPGVS